MLSSFLKTISPFAIPFFSQKMETPPISKQDTSPYINFMIEVGANAAQGQLTQEIVSELAKKYTLSLCEDDINFIIKTQNSITPLTHSDVEERIFRFRKEADKEYQENYKDQDISIQRAVINALAQRNGLEPSEKNIDNLLLNIKNFFSFVEKLEATRNEDAGLITEFLNAAANFDMLSVNKDLTMINVIGGFFHIIKEQNGLKLKEFTTAQLDQLGLTLLSPLEKDILIKALVSLDALAQQSGLALTAFSAQEIGYALNSPSFRAQGRITKEKEESFLNFIVELANREHEYSNSSLSYQKEVISKIGKKHGLKLTEEEIQHALNIHTLMEHSLTRGNQGSKFVGKLALTFLFTYHPEMYVSTKIYPPLLQKLISKTGNNKVRLLITALYLANNLSPLTESLGLSLFPTQYSLNVLTQRYLLPTVAEHLGSAMYAIPPLVVLATDPWANKQCQRVADCFATLHGVGSDDDVDVVDTTAPAALTFSDTYQQSRGFFDTLTDCFELMQGNGSVERPSLS